MSPLAPYPCMFCADPDHIGRHCSTPGCRCDRTPSMRVEPYDGPIYEGFEQDEPERVDEEYSDDEYR